MHSCLGCINYNITCRYMFLVRDISLSSRDPSASHILSVACSTFQVELYELLDVKAHCLKQQKKNEIMSETEPILLQSV